MDSNANRRHMGRSSAHIPRKGCASGLPRAGLNRQVVVKGLVDVRNKTLMRAPDVPCVCVFPADLTRQVRLQRQIIGHMVHQPPSLPALPRVESSKQNHREEYRDEPTRTLRLKTWRQQQNTSVLVIAEWRDGPLELPLPEVGAGPRHRGDPVQVAGRKQRQHAEHAQQRSGASCHLRVSARTQKGRPQICNAVTST